MEIIQIVCVLNGGAEEILRTLRTSSNLPVGRQAPNILLAKADALRACASL